MSVLKDSFKDCLLNNLSLEYDLKVIYFLQSVYFTLRPDIVIYNSERINLVELTVSFDERMADAKQRKLDKYEDLTGEITAYGFKATIYTIKVGVSGSTYSLPFYC